MPTAEEVEQEEGIGFFRNVWGIFPVTYAEAGEMVASEAEGLRALDAVAVDADSFERFAEVLDHYNPDDDDPDEDDAEDFARLATHADIESLSLWGLEIGVAGLSYALAAIGCVPVASCRGHLSAHAWSDHPVVFAAVDREHAEWLQPLVSRSSCGFDIDLARGEFLVIGGPSIIEMNNLASAILSEAEASPPPPLRLRPSDESEDEDEPALYRLY